MSIDIKTLRIGAHISIGGKRERVRGLDEDMQEKADERLYDSYECALSAGIASALELIKKGE